MFETLQQEYVLTTNQMTRLINSEMNRRDPADHAVATTAENGEDGSYYLAVLIVYQPTAKS